MRKDLNRGSILGGVVMLVTLTIVLFIFIIPGRELGPTSASTTFGTTARGGTTRGQPFFSIFQPSLEETSPTLHSYSNSNPSVYLNAGNAAYSYQPSEEYITLHNASGGLLNITGWILKNAKDKRYVEVGGKLRHYAVDEALIPRATRFISPYGLNVFQDIVLEESEEAILTTGKISLRKPYEIVSFKENICSGYLEEEGDYEFSPPLTRDCPLPFNEPGVEMLPGECQDFIGGMSYCHVPDFETRDANGELCRNCADGVKLSPICIAFLKERYNYKGCIANHFRDSEFSLNTWRVYLGKTWEMWAERRETISLFDQFGKFINSISY